MYLCLSWENRWGKTGDGKSETQKVDLDELLDDTLADRDKRVSMNASQMNVGYRD